MNIALVLQHRLLLSIQSLLPGKAALVAQASFWSPKHAQPVQAQNKAIPLDIDTCASSVTEPSAKKVMPLRVLRVVEQGQPRSCTGRLVISGRMADVCAELDRLVAREAALH